MQQTEAAAPPRRQTTAPSGEYRAVQKGAQAEEESWWRRLWTAPDPDLIDAGLRGEWMIAGIRLLLILFLLYLPLALYLQNPLEQGRQNVLWVAVAALAEALVIYSAVMRSWGRGWIGFFSGVLDVSLVTLGLWIFIRLDQPLVAVSDQVIFPIYLLAIGATSLRYDWRVSILTGATAVIQYAGLVAYVIWHWNLLDETAALSSGFSLNAQIGRGLLLVVSTVLAITLVVRAREQRRLSTRDRLTDLANRGFFDESMGRLEAIAERSGDSVGIVMIDVDHFKRFNDTYGHLAGDEALKRVADTLSDSFRTTDLIARYGGEEFSGLFPGMKMDDAVRRLDQIRIRISELRVPTDGEPAQVTVSMGVAVWPMDGESLSETLGVADLRLYEAKQRGRNQVVGSE